MTLVSLMPGVPGEGYLPRVVHNEKPFFTSTNRLMRIWGWWIGFG